MSHNTLATHKEVQGLIWSALKWVVLAGTGMAFTLGAKSAQLRADVDKALEGATTSTRVEKQVDSLRIEMRHLTVTNQEILRYLKSQ